MAWPRRNFTGAAWPPYFSAYDFCWLLRSTVAPLYMCALLVTLLALGIPLSWKKTLLGSINTWLGFVIQPAGPIVQWAKEKRNKVLGILLSIARGDIFEAKDLHSVMGRL